MSSRTRKIVLAVLLACASLWLVQAAFGTGQKEPAAGGGKSFKIGYSQFWGTNPFLLAMTRGAQKAVAEWGAKGVKIEMIVTNGGDTDPTKQVADVEDLHAQKVNGLLIFPGDSSVLSDPVKNIYNKEKIPVVVTDIGLASADYNCFLITDNYKGGEMAAEVMAKSLPKGAKVVSFDNAPGNLNGQNRRHGFEDRAKALGLTVLPEILVKLSLEDGRKLMEDTLVSTPDIGGVFFITQVVAQGAASALESANKVGQVKLVTFDVDGVSFKMVQNGQLLACVIQDPYGIGYKGMNIMIDILTGGPAPQKQLPMPAKLLTKENAASFADDPQVTGK